MRLNRYAVAFEFSAPACPLRVSEVLSDLKIIVHDRTIYSGRGVIRSLVDAGTSVVCEATLEETGWRDLELTLKAVFGGGLQDQFKEFIAEWQKLYKVLPEYKTVVADMHSFLTDLRLWMEQVELAFPGEESTRPRQFDELVTELLTKPVLSSLDPLFEKFESVAGKVEPDLAPVHYTYVRRQLHPIVLCAPLAYRAYRKPLGFAGDYETVNMMARNQFEGESLFAKLLNAWFLRRPPAEGHRNRLAYFKAKLVAETTRVVNAGRNARIFSLGCGPAWEVQQFMAESELGDCAEFILMDFNDETVDYVRDVLGKLKKRFRRRTKFEVIRQSAQQLLRHRRLKPDQPGSPEFDYVYCGGLFDYLPDRVCSGLLGLLYTWLAPGAALTVTNLHPSNPSRFVMEHLIDWHLIYRTPEQLRALQPAGLDCAESRIWTDPTGTNVFLELRKTPDA